MDRSASDALPETKSIRPTQLFVTLTLGLLATVTLLRLLSGLPLMALAQGPDGYATYYVAPSCDGVPAPCYTSVQAAVDAADEPGDVVKVAAGTYTDLSLRPRDDITTTGVVTQAVYLSKTVTLRGGYTTTNWTTSDPEANPTTLDAQRRGRVIYITGEISPTVEGLHLTGGDGAGFGGSPGGSDSGGGIYLITAMATLSDNEILSNTAETGGGLALLYNSSTLVGNAVLSNTAEGGGDLLLHDSDAILSNNTVAANTATRDGGGMFLHYSPATLIGDTVISNTALDDAGGVYLGYSHAKVSGNTVSSNTAASDAGGLDVYRSNAMLTMNLVESNTAGRTGGGLVSAYGDPTLSDNTVIGNMADTGGGLVFFDSAATLTNTVVADNRANAVGSGLHIWGSSLRLLHTTIARNSGGDGSGIFVRDDGIIYSTVALTSTILVSQAVGITVTAGSTATLEATLWGSGPWANGAHWGGTGSITTGTLNLWGDPAFVAPDAGNYHIGPDSAARDVGVDAGVSTDIDGQPRPMGLGFDLGADELAVALALSKQASAEVVQGGKSLTYTLHLTNTGDVTLTTTITDLLPAHVTPSGILSWSPTVSTPSGVWTQQVVVTVETGYSGALTNALQATALEGARGAYTHTLTVVGPDFDLYLPLLLRVYP